MIYLKRKNNNINLVQNNYINKNKNNNFFNYIEKYINLLSYNFDYN